jgi:hypothetical protein
VSFNRVWARFLRRPRTLAPSPGVREAWHQGRRWFHVTAVLLDAPALAERIAQTGACLDPHLELFSAHSPHVTCFVHGFADPASVRALPNEGEKVDVVVGGANAFASCVFLEVRSPRLPALRAALTGDEHRWAAYRPHVTVGLFRAAVPTEAVAVALRPLRALPPIRLQGRLHTCFVDAHSTGGHLHRREEIHS